MKVPLWARALAGIAALALVALLLSSMVTGLRDRIFGNPEVAREKGNGAVAREETRAAEQTTDQTIDAVRERDVYRETVREVVRQGQERINAADHGQQMDPAIDAATADSLCRLHDSLCRRPAGAAVQPLREPVSRSH